MHIQLCVSKVSICNLGKPVCRRGGTTAWRTLERGRRLCQSHKACTGRSASSKGRGPIFGLSHIVCVCWIDVSWHKSTVTVIVVPGHVVLAAGKGVKCIHAAEVWLKFARVNWRKELV